MKALVLAGGKGSRLRPLTFAMAKQLVPVANQPILHYPLDALYQAGITEIAIIISPDTGDAVRASVALWQAKQANTALAVTFIVQDTPAGLAHAVKIAQPVLGTSPFVMYLGDNLINHDLTQLIADFKANPCAASILLTPVEDPSQFGVAELDANGHVLSLQEKPKNPPSNLALIGVYLLSPDIFKAIEAIKPSPRGELEITDALQQLMTMGLSVRSAIHHGWWLDTGKKDDLLAANRVVLGAYIHPWDPGKTPLGTSVCPESIIEGQVALAEGVTVVRSHITGPVSIGANTTLTDSTVGAFTSIGQGCQLQGVTIANSVVLDQCQLSQITGPIDHSLMGHGCKITRSVAPAVPSHQFLLADCSEVQVL
jgi:glucose-1-phosphate thymidylyltransferase